MPPDQNHSTHCQMIQTYGARRNKVRSPSRIGVYLSTMEIRAGGHNIHVGKTLDCAIAVRSPWRSDLIKVNKLKTWCESLNKCKLLLNNGFYNILAIYAAFVTGENRAEGSPSYRNLYLDNVFPDLGVIYPPSISGTASDWDVTFVSVIGFSWSQKSN